MKDKSEIMNNLLQKYFENLEDYLIKSAELAGVSATATTERGEGAEDFVAKILQSHLPTRSAVATHRQIIGADAGADTDEGASGSVDVIVYNEWTTMPNLLDQGYILAESVYLALEVKSYKDYNNLKRVIAETVRDRLPKVRVRKRLRPETMYFGNIRKEGQLSLRSIRAFRPTYGILGLLWGEKNRSRGKSERKQTSKAAECLNLVQNSITEDKKKSLLCWPNVIYVPGQFLAFMVCVKAKIEGQEVDLHVLENEYQFLKQYGKKWPANGTITVQVPDSEMEEVKIQYYYLEKDNKTPNPEIPNLLYIFIFWLCQEILKFALEIPDYHRYLLPKEALDGREGARIGDCGQWEMVKYHGQNDEWR